MKVFIVDDSALVRERIIAMISEHPGVEITGQAKNAEAHRSAPLQQINRTAVQRLVPRQGENDEPVILRSGSEPALSPPKGRISRNNN